jgi:hypothetical protein
MMPDEVRSVFDDVLSSMIPGASMQFNQIPVIYSNPFTFAHLTTNQLNQGVFRVHTNLCQQWEYLTSFT